MNERRGGVQPRPKAGLIGKWTNQERANLATIFPTLWIAETSEYLAAKVSPSEIDIVVSRSDLGVFLSSAHCILFGKGVSFLPGMVPSADAIIRISDATSVGYSIPDIDPILSPLQKSMASTLETARGRPVIHSEGKYHQSAARSINEHLLAGAVLIADEPVASLGSIILRSSKDERSLGFAWLPAADHQIEWIRAIAYLWSRADPERLPGVGDWESEAEWSTESELRLRAQLAALSQRRESVNRQLNEEERQLAGELLAARTRLALGFGA